MTAHLLYVGGVDHHFRIPFLLGIRERGMRVTAAGTAPDTPFRQAGITYLPFHFDRFMSPQTDWKAIRSLARILLDVQPDLAQCYDTKPNLLLPLAARSIGHPGAIRTITGLNWVYSSNSPLAHAVRPVYRALHRLAARTTAATVFEMRDDQRFFERHRMAGRNSIVIPAGGGGIDVEGFDQALAEAGDRGAMRRELGLGGGPVVITVTRMTRQKGIATLLKAAAHVHTVAPDVRFLLVGPRESEGPLAISAAEIAQYAPYVVATGPRTDIPALLKTADLFAFPTEYREGVPRVLLEATLARLPIVSTDMPGCCEVVRDGWSGYLAPTHAPEKLAERIIRALREPEAARVMAQRAETVVRQTFGLRSIVDRHVDLYASLLAQRRSHPHAAPAWA